MNKAAPESRLFDPGQIRQEAFAYYRRLRRVSEYVSQHIDKPISLGVAAEIANLERTYFSRYFHCKTGVCFHDWLANVRIGKAKEYLRLDNRTISGTARSVGFNSLRTFERAFEKHAGTTARGYRKAVKPESRGR